MRKYFATVGTQLLMMLVAAVLALVPDATDAEITEAVEIVAKERGRVMRGPGLFVSAVPAVVKNIREARGRPLAATAITKPVSLGRADAAEMERVMSMSSAEFDAWAAANPDYQEKLDRWGRTS